MKKKLEWYVYADSINRKTFEYFNVFDHYRFSEDTKRNFKKNKDNFEEFKERLRGDLMYYFWSKSEWELILSSWVGRSEEKKIDVFDQIKPNLEIFTKYVWDFYTSRRRKKKEQE